jgi:TRAP-type C4-dicarboxylate transport system substrate-binding protein
MAQVQDAVFRHPAVVKELAQRWKSVYFLNQNLPIYEAMGNKRLASVDDLKGVRIRAGGEQGLVLRDFGAVITMIHPAEVYQGLEKGQIDVLTYPWTYAFGAYKLYEISDYATDGLALGPAACISAATIDAWNKLPKKLKAYMPEVRRKATVELFKAYAKADAKYIPIFKKNLELVKFPDSERQKLIAKAQPYWKAWAERQDAAGRPGTELLKFTKAQVAKFSK